MFLFFPVLRRGSQHSAKRTLSCMFLFFPVLRRGSCSQELCLHTTHVSILPRLATGIGSVTWSGRTRRFLFFPVLRRGSIIEVDEVFKEVSILPRLATGIPRTGRGAPGGSFLFFPVLRRGSHEGLPHRELVRFYSSPSCDGDQDSIRIRLDIRRFYSSPSCDGDLVLTGLIQHPHVSILPRLATGIFLTAYVLPLERVSILPRLATGILKPDENIYIHAFLFFPVLRRGSKFPVAVRMFSSFYSSPSCDGDQRWGMSETPTKVSILPRLATGIYLSLYSFKRLTFLFFPVLRRGSMDPMKLDKIVKFLFFPVLRRGSYHVNNFLSPYSFYSSPSCDGDPSFRSHVSFSVFLFFPVLRRGSQYVNTYF